MDKDSEKQYENESEIMTDLVYAYSYYLKTGYPQDGLPALSFEDDVKRILTAMLKKEPLKAELKPDIEY